MPPRGSMLCQVCRRYIMKSNYKKHKCMREKFASQSLNSWQGKKACGEVHATLEGGKKPMRRYVGLDTSTRTGVVILRPDGTVETAVEIHRDGKDPQRMLRLIRDVTSMLTTEDRVCIEDFAYAQAQSMALLGGIGWGIRMQLYIRGIPYHEVSTGQLKNFAGCKGNAVKRELILPVYEKWGFRHSNDNVLDAFVLSQVARALYEPVDLFKYQQDVIKKVKGRG